MLINQSDLSEILRSSISGATLNERHRIDTIISTVASDEITARLDSDSSVNLRGIVDAHKNILSEEASDLLSEIDIFGVNLDLCNAFARIDSGHKQIIVFDGLLYLIRFYADLVTILPLLNYYYPDETIEINGEKESVAQLFSTAGLSLIVDYIENGGALVDLSPILGPVAKRNSELGYLGAIVFLLAHEAGHIELGHCDMSYHSERYVGNLAIKEEIDNYQNQEFEADEFAFYSITEETRNLFISSIIFFMGPLAYSEIFHFEEGRTHPLAANRLSNLSEKVTFPSDPKLEVALKEIMTGEIERFRGFSAQREAYNGDARERIREVISFEAAHSIIRGVTDRLKGQGLVLEAY